MRTLRNSIILLSLVTAFAGCKKDDPAPKNVEPASQTKYYKGVLVINEGNFGSGNASISHYVGSNNTVTSSVYNSVNGTPVGDVLQSGTKIDSLLYFVVNNSGKILVVSSETMKLKATITGFNSPRYIHEVTGNKALVTELYSNKMYVIDLLSDTITATIAHNGWTERIEELNGQLYIVNRDRNKIIVMDKSSLAITDSVLLGDGLSNMVFDKNGKIWALSSGSATMSGRLYRIDPAGMIIEKTFSFADINARPFNLAVSPVGDQVYFINKNIYNMGINASMLPPNPLIQANNANYYGITVDENGDLYVTDAVDYVQRGQVYWYNASGSLINQFKAGINPNGVVFNR